MMKAGVDVGMLDAVIGAAKMSARGIGGTPIVIAAQLVAAHIMVVHGNAMSVMIADGSMAGTIEPSPTSVSTVGLRIQTKYLSTKALD